ncbi:zinc-dependent alcohol dehydrogenase family protein [Frankia sp. CNm7]|uniref:Zinc-dependent alcohol dehydrogenase family protein n=1 Tax=Frankia nepalensis TaxID=1836974 RepID=A0A937UMQ7_9ACTN|nr:zinc-dependent alcohol dehydrogenase family protein [Frankia nepalensis]MBL7494730.1 zinc-dependent alcohol dehydrogenase family protein [Frankia nepalensis]MBL7508721.1 zinc-dependent alcohol dehydrogenase family protein [Frankia nepalensis]MBL7522456.1 zinc-dependent alcohol dehydrogenase family protein [Frankia nepalensis]MBL7629084.1 zinc-dependent alcohol dehydrogenase family protein [Frankia nepalensis]
MPRVVVFDETGAPDVLHIVDEPVSEPAAGQVRVRIEAIGINRIEQMMRAGAYPRPIRLPRARIGCEGTGVVDAIGAGVEKVSVGDPVVITAVPDMDVNGTYAEFTVVPSSAVLPRPAGVDAPSAAALWVAYSTAYGALVEKAGARAGDQVLITAASSAVGLAAIQVVNQIGGIPLAVTRHAAKKDALLAAGAAAVFATDQDDVVAATRDHTGGAGADIILDAVMGPGLAELATAARFGGTLITVGWLDPRPASMPMNAPLTIYRYMSFEHTLDPAVVRRMAAFLGAGLRIGALRPTIDTVFSLDDIVEAHRHLELGNQIGKIVVTV